jgi:hypothetical protein
MSKKEEDILISILKFVYDNNEKGVSDLEILNHPSVKDNPIALSYINSQFGQLGSRNNQGFSAKLNQLRPDALFMFVEDSFKIILSENGYFKLLEYKELEEARQSSKRAQRTANWALFLAAAVGIWQIILTYFPPCK